MDPILFPTRQSTITLQDITTDNWHRIIRLVVNKDQLTLVPPNVESLCEHQFHLPQSFVKAIYADSTPVGYLRVQQVQEACATDATLTTITSASIITSSCANTDRKSTLPGTYQLQCFMIDQACQGLGFGTKALVQLQEQLVAQSTTSAIVEEKAAAYSLTTTTLKVSTALFAKVHPDDSPEHFFASVGFSNDSTGKEMVWVSRS
ncbi:hypothetical protein BGZ96_008652 [Linnemannia gamsii]|uniref:N-acetyltransferase domain-containing protein n=1 Tax=Linnemannia gamsii TaxID=64522 RepID=A0ABQ7JXT2_9FUNG|nr:hypothetical protein BGZ96_008652 [Linnemannia gamsii]